MVKSKKRVKGKYKKGDKVLIHNYNYFIKKYDILNGPDHTWKKYCGHWYTIIEKCYNLHHSEWTYTLDFDKDTINSRKAIWYEEHFDELVMKLNMLK